MSREFGDLASKLAKILMEALSRNSYSRRTYNSTRFSRGLQQGWAVSEIGFYVDLTVALPSRFLSSPFTRRVPFFPLFGFDKGT